MVAQELREALPSASGRLLTCSVGPWMKDKHCQETPIRRWLRSHKSQGSLLSQGSESCTLLSDLSKHLVLHAWSMRAIGRFGAAAHCLTSARHLSSDARLCKHRLNCKASDEEDSWQGPCLTKRMNRRAENKLAQLKIPWCPVVVLLADQLGLGARMSETRYGSSRNHGALIWIPNTGALLIRTPTKRNPNS